MSTKIIQKSMYGMTLFILCLTLCQSFVFANSDTLSVQWTETAPVIDGQEDDLWSSTNAISMDQYIILAGNTTTPSNPADLTCNFRALWDNAYIYLFINIIDDEINLSNPNTWEQDGVEMFFDGNNRKTVGKYDGIDDINIRFLPSAEHTSDIIFSPETTGFDPDRVQFIVKNTENGWDLEIAIPLEDLNIHSEVGALFGFEIQYNDNDSGKRDHIARWHSNNNDTWFNASLMGTAQLVSPPKYQKDLGVVSVEMDPVIQVNIAKNIKVSLKNFGTEAQSNFQIGFQIGSSSAILENYTNSISSDETAEFTFQTPWTPNQTGDYEITAFTSLTGDENTFNDKSKKTIKVLYSKDVGISRNLTPSQVGINKPVTISAEITNYGKDTQSGFPVGYQVNSGSWVTETYSKSLSLGQKTTYNFTNKWTPTALGTYRVTVKTDLSGDQNADNNSREKNVEVFNAAYMGAWRGTTSQNHPLFFHVNGEDKVDSISVDIRVDFGSASCVYTFDNSNLVPIVVDTFSVEVFASIGIPSGTHYPIVHCMFKDAETCEGTISKFSAAGGFCGGGFIMGTGYTNSSKTWSATRDYSYTHVEENVQAPENNLLSQNYPNPFNQNTTIEYSLPGDMHVSLKIFDIRGHEVLTLVQGEQPSGHYRVRLTNQNLPSGVYFYRLETDYFVQSRRMMILK